MGNDGADGSDSGEEAGEGLSELVGPQASSDEAIERDGAEPGEDARCANGPQVFAEYRSEEFEDRNGEGRVIDVAPIEPVGARKVVEFVAKVAVTVDAEEVDGESEGHDGPDCAPFGRNGG